MKKVRKRPPTSGSFRKGCKGGPGRLPKLKSNEDKNFLPITIPVYAEPILEQDSTFEDKVNYRNRIAEFVTFGYYAKTIYVPKEHVRRFLQIYKAGRLKDGQFTKFEAWKILVKEVDSR